MSVVSGKYAFVSGEKCVADWSMSNSVALQEYAASCTGGGTANADGNEDWTGSMSGKGYQPALLPADALASVKLVSQDGGSPHAYNCDIAVTQTQLNFPIAAGGPITWSSQFAIDGVPVVDVVGAADATKAEAPSAKSVVVALGATVIENVQNLTLTLSRPAPNYVSGGATKRLTGNLSASVSFEVLDQAIFNALYNSNVVNVLDIRVGASESWKLPIKWGTKSNYQVNAETRAPIGYTVNGGWMAVVPSAISASNIGFIQLPDDSYFFGVAPT